MTTFPTAAVDWLRRLAREPDGRDDARLLEAFVTAREEAAFAELLSRHGPLVLGVCRRLLREPHDVEDAFQATFLVLIRKARAIGRREKLAGWLYGVAFRTAQKARFRRSRRAAVERQGDMIAEPACEAASPNDAVDWLDRELLALPEKYRLPLVLCELQGLSADWPVAGCCCANAWSATASLCPLPACSPPCLPKLAPKFRGFYSIRLFAARPPISAGRHSVPASNLSWKEC